MRHRFIHWMLLLGVLASPVAMASQADLFKQANFPPRLDGHSPALELKSQGIMTYLWANVYAAGFYAEPSVSAKQSVADQSPKRLELYYFRDVDREDVIKAANTALGHQQSKETLARLRPEIERLHKSYEDISEGDRYDLTWDKQDGLIMTRNDKVIFASPDAELAKVYFAIWLAPDGLSDDLRATLLK